VFNAPAIRVRSTHDKLIEPVAFALANAGRAASRRHHSAADLVVTTVLRSIALKGQPFARGEPVAPGTENREGVVDLYAADVLSRTATVRGLRTDDFALGCRSPVDVFADRIAIALIETTVFATA
jgi:hypothetical protein